VTQQEAAIRLRDLFRGSTIGYGLGGAKAGGLPNVKVAYSARTIAGAPATAKEWVRHLDGAENNHLGIAPARLDGTCSFAALDIDYDVGVSIPELISRKWPDTHECPLIPVLSKSGWLHLFSFFNPRPIDVARAQMLCHVHDLRLDPSRVDIFPRHAANIYPDQVGSWIFMPYFGSKGEPLSLEEFIDRAETEVLRSLP
jgi:hypothetical protein